MAKILFITDTHISLSTASTGNKNKSWVSNDDTISELFTQDLVKSIKKSITVGEELYLIHTGDLADTAEAEEYQIASTFLNHICEQLSIPKNKVLILPGNHDVNRLDVDTASRSNRDLLKYEHHDEKFKNFKTFYDEFFKLEGKVFDPRCSVVDLLKIEEDKVLLIGMNSCYKCDGYQGKGFIDIPSLQKYLKDTIATEFEDYGKVALLHHNIHSFYSETDNNGFLESENSKTMHLMLSRSNIHGFICGHEHTSGGSKIDHGGSDKHIVFAGNSISLRQEGLSRGYSIIDSISNEVHISLERKRFNAIDEDIKVKAPFGSWNPVTNETLVNQMQLLVRASTIPAGEAEDFTIALVPKEKDIVERKSDIMPLPTGDFHEKIYELVQKTNVYNSGHFHWSDVSRAHNWIDVYKLLKNQSRANFITDAIRQTVENNKLEYDLIIGLGIEGNILASRLAATSEAPYSYFPYAYRFDDHSGSETELPFEAGKYVKPLIILDVVNSGKSMQAFFQQFDNHFSRCEHVSIVALFYTGKSPANSTLVRYKKRKISFNYLCHVKIEECPYGAEYKTECEIFCNKLDKVYEFYNNDQQS